MNYRPKHGVIDSKMIWRDKHSSGEMWTGELDTELEDRTAFIQPDDSTTTEFDRVESIGFVSFRMEANERGKRNRPGWKMHRKLTPDRARELAQELTEAADEAEELDHVYEESAND